MVLRGIGWAQIGNVCRKLPTYPHRSMGPHCGCEESPIPEVIHSLRFRRGFGGKKLDFLVEAYQLLREQSAN